MKLSERLAKLSQEAEEKPQPPGRERRSGEERREADVPVGRERRRRSSRREEDVEEVTDLHAETDATAVDDGAVAKGASATPEDDGGTAIPSTPTATGATHTPGTAAAPDLGEKIATTPDYGRSKKREGLEQLKTAVRSAAVKELGPRLVSGAIDEADLRVLLERHLTEAVKTSSVGVSPSDKSAFFDELIADMVGWGPLEALIDDATVTEIMCNSHDEIWVERSGVIERSEVAFSSVGSYRQVIDRMLAIAGRRVDESSPMADGRLGDGSRVNAIIPPLVVGEPVLTIRRFPENMYTAADLVAIESLSSEAAEFLDAAVQGKLNVMISGGTGTGKTTMLNVLSNFIPGHERVITIEDAAELRLSQPHIVRLEARPPNIEGADEVSIRDLVRNALRMRPDRIVIGEVRGAEALDMLQAMNTGHEGSLTTVHANTPRDALSRVETMVLFSGLDLPLRAIREQIAAALDLVIQLERRNDGERVDHPPRGVQEDGYGPARCHRSPPAFEREAQGTGC
jgi:pilus assembly protein CpaF